MKYKIIYIVISVISLVLFCFFYLGIELDIKFGLEHPSSTKNQIYETATKIRTFTYSCFIIFISTLVVLFILLYYALKNK